MGKVFDGIAGLVVGDALGVPVEFKQRDTYHVSTMIDGGIHNQRVGTWSDDSSMTIATIESIGRLGRISLEDIMNNFERWYFERKFTPYGVVFDIGVSTKQAIVAHRMGDSSKVDVNAAGAGALMRILPVALTVGGSMEEKLSIISSVGALTHPSWLSEIACCIYSSVVWNILDGMGRYKSIGVAYNTVENRCGKWFDLWDNYERIPKLSGMDRGLIRSSGYVVDVLEAALWCLVNTDNYRDCVLSAVNLGGDTDTIGAVVGGLAGLLYGVDSIPVEWLNVIPKIEKIKKLCERCEPMLNGGV